MKALRRLWSRPKPAAERKHFDALYYRAEYPDIAAARIEGFVHFMAHGWMEGRNPSKDFNTLFYRDRHLEGRRLNPLSHYATTGARLGLATVPRSDEEFVALQVPLARLYFSETYYRSQVTGVEHDLLQHYLRVGWRDHVGVSPTFDANAYVAEQAFVRTLGVSPLYHFASQQRFHSRRDDLDILAAREAQAATLTADPAVRALVAERFEADFYLSENDDVRGAGIDPLDHFLEHGWRENRAPSRLFDSAYYLQQSPEVARSGVNPFIHFLTVGEAEGRRPNPIGLRAYPPMWAPSDADWDAVAPARDAAAAACVVLMPVYKGHDETLAAIHAVLSSAQATPYALLVINDCSPVPALVAALEALAARGLFLYESNTANLGFVRTVNAGLARFADKDVALLNTDAKVSGDWLDRLLAQARREARVATVTPFSNNATIASYPVCNVNNTLEMETDASGLDRIAARCNAGRASELPVGIGFCMLMTAAARADIGTFDEELFGRGYGDENDFCVRAARAGWRNLLAEDVFVYHVGEVSFGIPHDKRRIRGQKELVAKHPDYPELISRHLAADPTEMGRVRIDLMRLAEEAGPAPVVHVLHALKGGIATHVAHEVRQSLADGRKAVLMRVGVKDGWSIDIASASPTAPYCPNLRSLSIAQSAPLLRDVLGWLAPSAILVHSTVGLGWAATTRLFEIIQESAIPYHVVLHDYTAFCHRNDLVQPNGRYCGLAPVETCRRCIDQDRFYPEATDPVARRETYARFLEGAARVIAPSRDVKARFEANGARYAIEVRPHAEATMPTPAYVAPRRPETFNVVTFGAIGIHKGSRVILNLARDAKARELPIRFHIVGYSDVTGELEAAGATETGRYERAEDAFASAFALEPSCIFLPSIWPETYCYALSMAFALACLPVVFDIGAQAERVRDAGFGIILPYDLIYNAKALNNRLMQLHDVA